MQMGWKGLWVGGGSTAMLASRHGMQQLYKAPGTGAPPPRSSAMLMMALERALESLGGAWHVWVQSGDSLTQSQGIQRNRISRSMCEHRNLPFSSPDLSPMCVTYDGVCWCLTPEKPTQQVDGRPRLSSQRTLERVEAPPFSDVAGNLGLSCVTLDGSTLGPGLTDGVWNSG